jgi:hypothetical protein
VADEARSLLVSTLTKVFVVLTSVLAIVLSCLTVATAARWSNLRGDLENFQTLWNSEFARRMNLETTMESSLAIKDEQLRSAQRRADDLANQVRQLTDDLAKSNIELARARNEATSFEAGRKKLEELLAVQTAELTSTQKQNQTLLAQNIDLQTRNQRLATRNLELTGQLTIATDETRNLQEKLYAAEQMARDTRAPGGRGAAPETPAGTAAMMAPVAGPIRGEVTQVDSGYVTVNIGETSGVVKGMEFAIVRNDTYVGDFRIEVVNPKNAGGKVTLLKQGQQVQVGDRVIWGLERS